MRGGRPSRDKCRQASGGVSCQAASIRGHGQVTRDSPPPHTDQLISSLSRISQAIDGGTWLGVADADVGTRLGCAHAAGGWRRLRCLLDDGGGERRYHMLLPPTLQAKIDYRPTDNRVAGARLLPCDNCTD